MSPKMDGQPPKKMNRWRRALPSLDRCLVSWARLVVSDLCEAEQLQAGLQAGLQAARLDAPLLPGQGWGGETQLVVRDLQALFDNTSSVS